VDDVCDVIRRCKHLPGGLEGKIREEASLGYRIKHDWIGLASAAMHLDSKIREGDVTARSIKKPLAYLLKVFAELVDPEKTPPGLLAGLKDRVQASQESPASEPAAPVQHGECANEPDYRQEVGVWYRTAKSKGVPDPDILPQILAHIDSRGAAKGHASVVIELRKSWAADEVQRLAAEGAQP
jgi:hypothetical protein